MDHGNYRNYKNNFAMSLCKASTFGNRNKSTIYQDKNHDEVLTTGGWRLHHSRKAGLGKCSSELPKPKEVSFSKDGFNIISIIFSSRGVCQLNRRNKLNGK